MNGRCRRRDTALTADRTAFPFLPPDALPLVFFGSSFAWDFAALAGFPSLLSFGLRSAFSALLVDFLASVSPFLAPAFAFFSFAGGSAASAAALAFDFFGFGAAFLVLGEAGCDPSPPCDRLC